MANPFFKFKQFTVYHDKSAMKVGTDGVLIGAWAHIATANSILDIGTGSGLIALMLAQRAEDANIDAIDIDADAIEQAKENVSKSPFKNRIKCYLSSLKDFADKPNSRYDLIVSNPPFFAESLKANNKKRTIARHTDTLTLDELIRYSKQCLTTNGRLSFIYPSEQKARIIKTASEYGFYITRLTHVFPTPSANAKRVLVELALLASNICIEESLILEESRHKYTDAYIELTKDFYLNL